jgi:hypothetical protein
MTDEKAIGVREADALKIAQHFQCWEKMLTEIQKPVKRATEGTEPGAVATGCEHTTREQWGLRNCDILRKLDLASPRYRSGFCIFLSSASRTIRCACFKIIPTDSKARQPRAPAACSPKMFWLAKQVRQTRRAAWPQGRRGFFDPIQSQRVSVHA